MEINWFEKLKENFNAGVSNFFVLNGNINDYVYNNLNTINFLTKFFLQKKFINSISIFNYGNDIDIIKKSNTIEKGKDAMTYVFNLIKEKQDNLSNVIIFRYPEYVVPKNMLNIQEYTKSTMLTLHKLISNNITSNNIIIFVADSISSLNPMFLDDSCQATLLKIPYPNEMERYNFIKNLVIKNNLKKYISISLRQISKLTAGLTKLSIEDILLEASTIGINNKMIVDKKKKVVQKMFGDILEIYDVANSKYTLKNFAGQKQIKDYHKEVIINPIKKGEDTSIIPKGLLYVGPPGTGKTYFAKCLAGEAGINFVEFKLSKILGKYVGESEKNLEKVFNCLESLAPCGVFIDEIDQALGRGDNDNTGVRASIFGMMLSFMSEPSHRGKIIFIGATNYPNKIDEALKRPGRFDKKIPFLPPNTNERIETIKMYFGKLGKCNLSNDDYCKLASITEGYTPAEIEDVSIKCLEIMKRKGINTIDKNLIVYSISCIKRRCSNEIDNMIKIALDECNDIEFIPMQYRK